MYFLIVEKILEKNLEKYYLIQAKNKIKFFEIFITQFSKLGLYKNGFHIISHINQHYDPRKFLDISAAIEIDCPDHFIDYDFSKIKFFNTKNIAEFFKNNSNESCLYTYYEVIDKKEIKNKCYLVIEKVFEKNKENFYLIDALDIKNFFEKFGEKFITLGLYRYGFYVAKHINSENDPEKFIDISTAINNDYDLHFKMYDFKEIKFFTPLNVYKFFKDNNDEKCKYDYYEIKKIIN